MYTPKVVYIETTNLCNAECVMCPHTRLSRNQGVMSESVFKKIIADCEAMNLNGTQLFLHKEGEPLLDLNIAQRIRYTKIKLGNGNVVGINTNAMLLTKEKSEEIIESGLDTIYISLDGICKESYEKIRVNLNYDIVVQNIRKFFEVKSKKKSSIKVIMQMLITDDIRNNAKEFKRVWGEFPCEFYIKRMHSYLDGGHSSLTCNLLDAQVKVCNDPFEILVVYKDGNIGLCCWDYNNEYCIGNVKTDSLFNIYNNKKATVMRKSQKDFLGKEIVPCNRCARIFGEDEISKY